MANKGVKTGKEVIDEFFSEILNVKNVDSKTVEVLIELYSKGKLTDTNIQNELDNIVQSELKLSNKK